MDIPYHTEPTIFNFRITNTMQESAQKGWKTETARIHSQAKDVYYRDLSLDQRIQYIHDYLMARVYTWCKFTHPLDECVRQLNNTISWYMWRGEVFRLHLSSRISVT
jgi:hypothetical protein